MLIFGGKFNVVRFPCGEVRAKARVWVFRGVPAIYDVFDHEGGRERQKGGHQEGEDQFVNEAHGGCEGRGEVF